MAKGKPGSSPLLRPDADAVSLHSAHGGGSSRRAAFLDADDDAPELFLDGDDIPPLYSDVVNEGAAAAAVPARPSRAPGAGQPSECPPTPDGQFTPWRYAIVPVRGRADADVRQLVGVVTAWAQTPLRPYVQLRGTHTQTVDNNGKTEKREVVDFDVKVELTPFLYADARARTSWRTLRTPDNRDKVRRGTVFRCQAPAASGRPRLADAEAGGADGEDSKPSLEDWCRRFCDDPAPLRALQLERRMVGFDYQKVRAQMEALVRRTNYRGHLQVAFPADEVGLVYYSDHRFNRWRLLRWVQALCVLTLTILVAWPYLFFRTKRYEVVTVDWPFSRTTPDGRTEYVSLSEDQWYNLWGRAIAANVLGKRQGTLDQEDLRRAEGAEPTFETTGNTAVDGALGIVRAGITAMNHVNRQMGWGGDS